MFVEIDIGKAYWDEEMMKGNHVEGPDFILQLVYSHSYTDHPKKVHGLSQCCF